MAIVSGPAPHPLLRYSRGRVRVGAESQMTNPLPALPRSTEGGRQRQKKIWVVRKS